MGGSRQSESSRVNTGTGYVSDILVQAIFLAKIVVRERSRGRLFKERNFSGNRSGFFVSPSLSFKQFEIYVS